MFKVLKFKRVCLVKTFLVLFVGVCIGEVGSTGWLFLKKVNSVRPRSLVFVNNETGSVGEIIFNPSVLGVMKDNELVTMFETGLIGDKTMGIVYGKKLGKVRGVAVGVLSYDTGKETLYWLENDMEQTRTVTAESDFLGIVSYGQKFSEKIIAGVNIKYLKTTITEKFTANSYSIDFGILLTFNDL